MATLNFLRLTMGEMKIGIYCCLIADIFTKVFLEMFVEWSSTNMYFLSKPLNLIGCHGNQKAKFVKNIQKSTPQKLY